MLRCLASANVLVKISKCLADVGFSYRPPRPTPLAKQKSHDEEPLPVGLLPLPGGRPAMRKLRGRWCGRVQ